MSRVMHTIIINNIIIIIIIITIIIITIMVIVIESFMSTYRAAGPREDVELA